MSYYKYSYYNSHEITKREILFSIVIISLMLLIGLVIHGNISDNMMNKYQKYNTAVHIENDKDLFEYGMCTDIGDSLVYGELKAVDTVTYPEIKGEYSYVKKVMEKYTRHVSVTSVNGKTKTRVYYTWDYVDSWSKHCKKISFLGHEFNYNKIKLPSSNYIATEYKSSIIRYVYYGKKTSYTGTLYASLQDDTINNAKFYNKMSIDETVESLKSDTPFIIFWAFWIVLTIGLVAGFYYLENNWLED